MFEKKKGKAPDKYKRDEAPILRINSGKGGSMGASNVKVSKEDLAPLKPFEEEKNQGDDTLSLMSKEIALWLSGEIQNPPEGIREGLKDANEKITWVLVWNVVRQLARISRHGRIIDEIEERLTKKDALEDYTTKELLYVHKQLTRSEDDVLNFARKFISQNQDVLDRLETPTDNLKEILRNLDPEMIDVLVDLLKGV